MDELIIKPEEAIVLQPGEMLEAGAQGLRIRCGLIDFSVPDGSTQQQILASIARCLRLAIPTDWQIITVKHFRQLVNRIEEPLVALIPQTIAYRRTARGTKYNAHDIDVLVIGKLDVDATVAMIERWTDIFLDGGGSLDNAACMEAAPIDGAEAGYDVDELTKTPSTFLGGLRLTFWEM